METDEYTYAEALIVDSVTIADIVLLPVLNIEHVGAYISEGHKPRLPIKGKAPRKKSCRSF